MANNALDPVFANELAEINGSFTPTLRKDSRARTIDAILHEQGEHSGATTSVRHFDDATGKPMAYVINDGQHTIVSFSPTMTYADMHTNLNFALVDGPFKGSKVHAGYSEYLNAPASDGTSLWDKISSTLKEPEFSGHSVTYTGLSMGGALATLASAQHAKQAGNAPIEAVYTYGQPMVGDNMFAAYYDATLKEKHHRIIGDDIVTQFPPEGGYKHVGTAEYVRGYSVDRQSGGLGWRESGRYYEKDAKTLSQLDEKLQQDAKVLWEQKETLYKFIQPGITEAEKKALIEQLTSGPVKFDKLMGYVAEHDGYVQHTGRQKASENAYPAVGRASVPTDANMADKLEPEHAKSKDAPMIKPNAPIVPLQKSGQQAGLGST